MRTNTIAASLITGFSVAVSTPVASAIRVPSSRRRRIMPQAGHAVEIPGHAIEYLTDEFVQCCAEVSPKSAELEAVPMLMALNRQAYCECPEVSMIGERLRPMLHLRAA